MGYNIICHNSLKQNKGCGGNQWGYVPDQGNFKIATEQTNSCI